MWPKFLCTGLEKRFAPSPKVLGYKTHLKYCFCWHHNENGECCKLFFTVHGKICIVLAEQFADGHAFVILQCTGARGLVMYRRTWVSNVQTHVG